MKFGILTVEEIEEERGKEVEIVTEATQLSVNSLTVMKKAKIREGG